MERLAALALLLDVDRTANTLVTESQTSGLTDATTALLSTRMSKLTGTLPWDSTATALAMETQPMARLTSKTPPGHLAALCPSNSASPNVLSSTVATRSL